MDPSVSTLLLDLKRLRRGWGLAALDVLRIGPSIEAITGKSDDREAQLRRLTAAIRSAAHTLPVQIRHAALVGLGLDEDMRRPTFEGRLDALAAELDESQRTARRRVDHAMLALARQLAVQGSDGTGNWHYQLFEAVLRLDTPTPEAIEHRTVIVTSGDINQLDTSISVPRHPKDTSERHSLEVELLYGGRVVLKESAYETHFRQVIETGTTLTTGDSYRYSLRLRIPKGQPMAPHYVYVPLRECESFDLRVKFSLERLPSAVWRLDAVPTAVIYEGRPVGELLKPDRFGEVHTTFDELQVGLGFGICWTEV